ncbi:MAG: GAF domain-containing protein [Chloroflexaceae bacterium]|jgi:transcriptional regulator with GAF, ATPase, and Fis domain|nr:GAF domain-containing protein [Chloroflexaceae bacterium]
MHTLPPQLRLTPRRIQRRMQSPAVASTLSLVEELTELAQSPISVDDALRQTLECVCRYLGWPVGHAYYRATPTSQELTSAAVWHVARPQKFRALQAVSAETHFAPGKGLVGKAYATGQPVWSDDVLADTEFVRRRDDLRVHGYCAAPILVHHDSWGVLEFFAAQPQAYSPTHQQVVTLAANLLGQGLERIYEQQRTQARQLDQAESHDIHPTKTRAIRRTAISDYSTAVAHEVNNPLYAARLAMSLLEQDLQEVQVSSPYLAILREELNRVATVMQQVQAAGNPLSQTELPSFAELLAETGK